MSDCGVAKPTVAPRWLAILVAVLALPVGAFGVLGGYALVIDPPPGKPALGLFAGLALILLAVWVCVWSGRLLLHRPAVSAGLLSPVALRLGGSLLILLPIGGVFTGVYTERRMSAVRVLQAAVYVMCGLGAFRLANARSGRTARSEADAGAGGPE